MKDLIALPTKTVMGVGLFALREFRRHDKIYDINIFRMDGGQAINYTNHSCSPNAQIVSHAAYALRDIKEAEEVTVDYRDIGFACLAWDFECYCLQAGCRGRVQGGRVSIY
jgi:hypothetical protein